MPAALAAFLMLAFCGVARGQAPNLVGSKDDFSGFIEALAEANRATQFKYALATLTERYDEGCEAKTRQVKRDEDLKKWPAILPNQAAREKDDLSFIAESTGDGRGRVYLSKNETWLYGLLDFTWDEANKRWLMTGFQTEMPEPGECP